MDSNQKQQQSEKEQQGALWSRAESDEVVPGVPVIRSNTPRPVSFEALMASQLPPELSEGVFPAPSFPSMAPSAPPLPEEVSDEQERGSSNLTPTGAAHATGGDTHEFSWLFEYSLEMDPATLNTPDRLNGLALLYGNAILKGYRLLLGSVEEPGKKEEGLKTFATIVPDSTPGAQVWGVLYRIPKRLTDHVGNAPSVLDSAHMMNTAPDMVQELHVVVHDMQHDRDIPCLTYGVTEQARRKLSLVPVHLSRDLLFVQRLAALARSQRFSEPYLREEQRVQAAPALNQSASYAEAAVASISQDTDPLPVMAEQRKAPVLTNTLPETPLAAVPVTLPAPPMTAAALPRPSRLLIVFSAYLVLLLALTISFAVLQGIGLWNNVLNTNFVPLSVPWLVMLYGLLGGCISSIVTLDRCRSLHPPAFVLVSWFTRPFLGAILAAFSYLLLTSGIFVLSASPQHMPVFLLAGALAGLSEGVLFKRK